MGTQAVVTLPEHIDASNSGLVREQLLSLINRGAAVLVADMTATVSCDHGDADALARVYQRATVSGTRLRMAVTTPIVRAHPRRGRAEPAHIDLPVCGGGRRRRDSGKCRTPGSKGTRGPDRGRPPGSGAAATPGNHTGQDASTFPVRVSLSPVPTATGHFIMAVVRDMTDSQPRADLADLAHAATAAGEGDRGRELLDRVAGSLYHVGLSLQNAIELPHDAARERIAEAARRPDDTMRDIQDHVLASRAGNLP